jgi:sporulation protein YlmC with PRC-barrel domain
MKTSTLLVATLLGLAIVSTQAQTQSSTTTSFVQTSKIVGMKVKDSGGQEVGVVKDVVLDRNTGCMAYTVLSTGGTGTSVAGGTKTVAVPWTVYTATADPSVMTVRVDRDRVYNAPAFDYARIDEYSRSGYINNIYSYYGAAPAIGVGVGVSGTTATDTYGTQTGVAGQTAATASPTVGGSPAATAMASPSAAASASPAATAKATPSWTAATSHRPPASPSATAEEQKGERKSRRHGESETTATPGTSSSEEGTTEQKAGRHHKTTEEEGTTSETGTSKKRERSKEKSEAEPTATP